MQVRKENSNRQGRVSWRECVFSQYLATPSSHDTRLHHTTAHQRTSARHNSPNTGPSAARRNPRCAMTLVTNPPTIAYITITICALLLLCSAAVQYPSHIAKLGKLRRQWCVGPDLGKLALPAQYTEAMTIAAPRTNCATRTHAHGRARRL